MGGGDRMGAGICNVMSLFSGMGGLDLGLKKAGCRILVQIDKNPCCIETLRKNWKSSIILKEDLSRLNARNLLRKLKVRMRDIDIIAGGPPCQPFSRSNEGKRKGIKDGRGFLILKFGDFVKDIKPEAFIMENVPGLLSSNKGKDFRKLLAHYKKIGYYTYYKILNAADYGVPQKRKRLFLVGFKRKVNFEFPPPTHDMSNNLKPLVTAGEALEDLDDGIVYDSRISIGGKYGHLINEIPPGLNYLYYTDRFSSGKTIFKNRSKFWTFLLKLDPSKPSATIQTQPWSSVGPFHWNNRRLTIDEIKRLQGIPDTYYVAGDGHNGNAYTSDAWVQIGDAVPPKLAEVVGKQVIRFIR
jgi:DNA (cytosine-5)-methyltransferase 1